MCDVKLAPVKALGTKPKEKRRNSEKRKAKSRDAARCRRSRESQIFSDLGSQLPVPETSLRHLDKTSVMRLGISYIKIRNYVNAIYDSLKDDVKHEEDSICLNAMGGFLLVLSVDGDMVYLSENVTKYLGLTQIDLMGQSIFDYSHPCDHTDIKEMLSLKPLLHPFSYFIRMTCTLSGRGRNVNLKSASFKVIHYTGYVRCKLDSGEEEESSSFLLTVGEPVPHPSNIESLLDKQTFLSRHSLDMKFTYVDDRIEQVLGYSPDELMTKSIYSLCHALDLVFLEKSFKILFSKGQCITGQYRFLAKYGGYVWILTEATVIYESTPSKPQCVVCINYVVSGREKKDEIVSEEQVIPKMIVAAEDPPVPKASTKSIFAPRTADMNTGFLTFADDNSELTVFKDEPEDLTHLAPQAGDVCVLLPGSEFMPEMYGDGLSKDQYEESKLLSDESLLSEDPTYSCMPQCSPLTNDPFLSYREDQPKLGSGSGDKELCEDRKTMDDLELDEMQEEDEFAERAPYIPMNGSEDILLLTPPDSLLWDAEDDLDVHPPGKLSLSELMQSDKRKEVRESGSHTLHCQLPSPATARRGLRGSTTCISVQNADGSKLSPKRITLPGGKSGSQKRLKMDPRILTDTGIQSSVLLNLLLNGEDSNYGYLCNGTKPSQQHKRAGDAIDRTSNTLPSSLPTSTDLSLPPLSEI